MIYARAWVVLSVALGGLMAVPCGCTKSAAWLDERDRTDVFMQRAAAQQAAGNVAAAIKLYQKALEQNPQLARAQLDIALLLHDHEKDYVGAIYHYRRYLELRPDSEKAEMIQERIRVASQLLAAALTPERDRQGVDRVKELEDENGVLGRRLKDVEGQLKDALARKAALEKELVKVRQTAEAASSKPKIVASRPAPVAGVEPARTETPERKVVRTYRVRQGDSLSSIAAEVYRDGSQWERIHEANRDLLKNSYDLKVGMVLVVP